MIIVRFFLPVNNKTVMQRLILGPTVSGGGTVGAERHGGHQLSGLVREGLEEHNHFSVGRCPRQQFRCSWENVH